MTATHWVYMAYALTMLHCLLDWIQWAPSEGSWDVGNTEPVGRALVASLVFAVWRSIRQGGGDQ